MGLDELSGNGITVKVLYFLTDRTMTPYNEPLRRVRKSRICLFVTVQLIAFGATFAITQTVGTPFSFRRDDVERIDSGIDLSFFVAPAAVGFPVIILLMVPLRTLVVPCLPFSDMELEILDRPTASPFVSGSNSVITLVVDRNFSRPCNQLVDSRSRSFGVSATSFRFTITTDLNSTTYSL